MRQIICSVFILISSHSLWAQIVFQRSYGGVGSEYGRAVVECSSGGYLLVGSTNSYFDSSTDMYILRVDEVGDYVWGRSIGMPNRIDWAQDVKETADGDFLVSGYTNATDLGDYDGSLIKIDSDGNLIWSRNYGGEDWDFIENMALSESGEIYLAGQSTLDGQLVGWLIKTNEAGDVIWEREFEGNGMARLTGVDICETGEIVFTGYNYSVLFDLNTQISGRVYENGETNWVTGFPQIGNITTQNCVCDYDNRLLTSSTFHEDSFSTALYSAINAETGEIEWLMDAVHDELFGSAVGYNDDGNILIAFSGYNFGPGGLDGFVHTRGPNGEWLGADYASNFGGVYMDAFYGIIPTSDGGLAAVGETDSFGNNAQMFLVKVNADNEFDDTNEDFLDLATNNAEVASSWSEPWPNPTSSVLNITSLKPLNSGEYHIFDMGGQVLIAGKLIQKNGNVTINVANLSMGVYFIQITEENGQSFSYKFVKAN